MFLSTHTSIHIYQSLFINHFSSTSNSCFQSTCFFIYLCFYLSSSIYLPMFPVNLFSLVIHIFYIFFIYPCFCLPFLFFLLFGIPVFFLPIYLYSKFLIYIESYFLCIYLLEYLEHVRACTMLPSSGTFQVHYFIGIFPIYLVVYCFHLLCSYAVV
jgi:hypothetical protein